MRALSRSRTSSTFKVLERLGSLVRMFAPRRAPLIQGFPPIPVSTLIPTTCSRKFTVSRVSRMALLRPSLARGLRKLTRKSRLIGKATTCCLWAQATSLAEKRTRFKRVEVALPAKACAMMLRGSASPSFQMRPPREEAPGAWLRTQSHRLKTFSRSTPAFSPA